MQTEDYPNIRRKSRAAFDVIFKEQPEKFILEPVGTKDSILGQIALKEPSIFRYKLEFKSGFKTEFIGKWKSRKLIINGAKVICADSISLLTSILLRRKVLGFNHSEYRENAFYQNVDSSLKQYLIEQYWHIGDQNGVHFLAMEEIKGATRPKTDDFKKIIDIITDFHAKYYQKRTVIEKMSLNYYTDEDYNRSSKMLLKMWRTLSSQNDVIFTTQEIDTIENFIKNIAAERKALPNNHFSLTHNDLSTRNIFKKDDNFYIYDWEMACYQNPEHDLIELLCSNLGKMTDAEIISLIKYFRSTLTKKTGRKLSDKEFRSLLRFNLLEFSTNKLSSLRLFNLRAKVAFINQFTKNSARLIRLFGI